MSVGGSPIPLVIQAFAGLATTVAADARPGGMVQNQARLLRNLDLSDGDLVVRKGHKRQRVARVDGTRPILAVFRALKGSTQGKKTIVQTRNKLWTLSGSAVASISGSALTLTSGNPHVMCSYQDAVYGVNGKNSFWSWTFTGKIAGALGPTKGKYKIVFAFEEKLVHVADTSTYSKVSWSDEGLPTTYQTLHNFFYPVDRSSRCVLGWPMHGEIILAGPERTGKTVGGLPPQAVVDIDTRYGCVSYYSAAELAGWLYFVANGPTVVRTNGNVVDDEFSKGVDFSDVDIGTERHLRGIGYKNRYYILSYNSVATGTGGSPDRQLVYDSWRNQWYGPHQGNRISAVAEFRAPGDDGRLLGGSPSGFAAIYYSGSADGGTKITGVYEGPVFRGPDPIHRLTVDEYGIMAAKMTSGSVTVGCYFDRRTTASSIGTVALKASGLHEGDRDRTTVTRTTIVGALKPNPRQAFMEYQPRLSIAQKSGRARVRMFWMQMRQVKER